MASVCEVDWGGQGYASITFCTLKAPGINPSASSLTEKGSVPDRQQQQKQVF